VLSINGDASLLTEFARINLVSCDSNIFCERSMCEVSAVACRADTFKIFFLIALSTVNEKIAKY